MNRGKKYFWGLLLALLIAVGTLYVISYWNIRGWAYVLLLLNESILSFSLSLNMCYIIDQIKGE